MVEKDAQTLKGVIDVINDIVAKASGIPKDAHKKIDSLNKLITEVSFVNKAIATLNESLAPGSTSAITNLNLQKAEIKTIIEFVNSLITTNINRTKIKSFHLIFKDVSDIVIAINAMMMDLNSKLTHDTTDRAQATLLLEHVDKIFRTLIDLNNYKDEASDHAKAMEIKVKEVVGCIKAMDDTLTNLNLKALDAKVVDNIIERINLIADKTQNVKDISKAKDAIMGLNTLMENLNEIFKKLDAIKVKILIFNALGPIILMHVAIFGVLFASIIRMFVKSFIMVQPSLDKPIGQSSLMILGIIASIEAIIVAINSLSKVLLKHVTSFPVIYLSFGLLGKSIHILLSSMVDIANSMAHDKASLNQFLADAPTLGKLINAASSILQSMSKFSTSGLGILTTGKIFDKKFQIMSTCVINMLKRVVEIVDDKFREHMAKVALFLGVVNSLIATVNVMVLLSATMIMASPVLLVFALLGPALVLAFGAFVLILKLIIWAVTKLIDIRMIAGIILLGIIVTAMIVVTIELVALAIMSVALLKVAKQFLLGLVVIATAVIAILLIGALVALALPIMPYMLLGLVAMVVVVGLMLLTGAALMLLGELNLDQDKILGGVDTIFNTVQLILGRMFENWLPRQQAPGFWGGLLNMVGKGFAMLFGIPFMVATFIVVIMVLLTAAVLRDLQTLNLNPRRILDNVDTLFDTVHMILDRLWGDQGMDKISGKKNGVFDSLIDFISPKLGAIWGMLTGADFLIVSVFAVASIVLMVSMLRTIQTINLNPQQIMNNVETIFDIINSIIDFVGQEGTLFSGHGEGWVEVVLRWCSPGLSSIWRILSATTFLVVSVLAIGSILALAEMLRMIGSIKIDRGTIRKNIEDIFNTINYIIDFIGQEGTLFSGHGDGWIETILRVTSPGLSSIWRILTATVFLISATIAIGAIWGMSKMLDSITKMNIDTDKIRNNIKVITETINTIIDFVSQQGSLGAGKGDGLIETLLRMASPGLTSVWRILTATAFLVSTTIAIGAVWGIAKMLKAIIGLALDTKEVNTKVREIFDCVRTIMEGVLQTEKTANKGNGLFGSVITFFLGDHFAAFINAIMMIAYVAMTFFVIALVKALALQLKDIAALDKNDFDKAGANVGVLFDTLDAITNRIFYGKEEATKGGKPWYAKVMDWMFINNPMIQLVQTLMMVGYIAMSIAVVGMVKILAKTVSELAEIKTAKLKDAGKKVNEILQATDAIKAAILNKGDNIPEPKKDPWWKRALSAVADITGISTLVSLFQTLKRFSIVGSGIAVVAPLHYLAKMIGEIGKFNISRAQAENKTRNIIGASAAIKNTLLSQHIDGYKEAAIRADKIEDRMDVISNQFVKISQWLSNIGGVNTDDIANVGPTIKQVLETSASLIVKINERNWSGGAGGAINNLNKMNSALMGMENQMRIMAKHMASINSSINLAGSGRLRIMLAKTFEAIDYLIKAAISLDVHKATSASNNLSGLQSVLLKMAKVSAWLQNISMPLDNQPTKMIDNLAEFVRHLDDIHIGDETKRTVNVLMDCLRIVGETRIDRNNYDQNLQHIDELNKRLRSIVKVTTADVRNAKALTDNYIRFIDKVDAADFRKLRTTEQMMKWWAMLSRSINGNFDSMAQAINEHIMPMLKELQHTMDGVSQVQREIISQLTTTDELNAQNSSAADMPEASTPSSIGGGPSDFSIPSPVGGVLPDKNDTKASAPKAPVVTPTGLAPRQSALGNDEVGKSKANPLWVKIVK